MMAALAAAAHLAPELRPRPDPLWTCPVDEEGWIGHLRPSLASALSVPAGRFTKRPPKGLVRPVASENGHE